MGFKKASSKKKVKKAPGKKGRKDGWDLEGGQFTEEIRKSENSSEIDGAATREKRGPRKTQERDEYIRRGKAKNEDRKRKGQFEKKMSKKMRFDDVIKSEMKASEGTEYPPEEIVMKRKPIKSNRTVMERLQNFFLKDLAKAPTPRVLRDSVDHDASAEIEIDGLSDEEYEMDAEEYAEMNGDDDEDEASDVEDEQVDIDDDHDDELDSESDDELNSNGPDVSSNQDDYDWMFNPVQSQVTSLLLKQNNASKEPTGYRNDLQKLSDFDGFQLYGALNPTVGSRTRHAIERFGDIVGLHKMWRSRSSEEVSGKIASEMLPFLGSYADILMEGRDHTNDQEILHASLLHSCGHLIRARSKVLKHNQKAKKRSAELAVAAAVSSAEIGKKKKKARREAMKLENEMGVQDLADQGFCRPRVLVLCPYRGTAFKIIESIKNILGDNTSMSNKEKFEEEFGPPDDDSDEEEDNEEEEEEEVNEKDTSSSKNKKKGKGKGKNAALKKPDDWKALFKGSNMDDDFKLGLQINPGQGKGTGADRGAYLRMYCDFFQSDMIIASPLGLRLLIEKNASGGSGKLNADFLSSLEIVILHQSDVMYMQNWEHVEYIMQRTNKLAENDRGSDFSRIRPYFLEGKSVEHRQLIVTTQFNDPTIQSSFRTHGQSVAGCVRVRKTSGDGCISQVVNRVKQVFQLIRATSFGSQEESRFQYFKESVLNQVLRLNQSHTLIVTPSYLSFIRVRNELIRREASVAYVSEYSRDSEVSRGRSKFFHGKTDLMLYSGRAHFFRRYQLRGAQHVIFYSLPEYAHFYSELVNSLGDSGEGLGSDISCLVLFTQYERMALERMVGAKRCAHILSSAKTTFMFC